MFFSTFTRLSTLCTLSRTVPFSSIVYQFFPLHSWYPFLASAFWILCFQCQLTFFIQLMFTFMSSKCISPFTVLAKLWPSFEAILFNSFCHVLPRLLSVRLTETRTILPKFFFTLSIHLATGLWKVCKKTLLLLLTSESVKTFWQILLSYFRCAT